MYNKLVSTRTVDSGICPVKFSHSHNNRRKGIHYMSKPKILIWDEPTTALDVTIQAQILELMMELQKKLGMAIIMITHDLTQALHAMQRSGFVITNL